MNNVSLSGFVGKQPTIRKSEGGNETIATFSIAVKQFSLETDKRKKKRTGSRLLHSLEMPS